MKASLTLACLAWFGCAAIGAHAGPISISLGSASSFAVLAGSAVTNTGSSIISGNLGVWPSQSITGFPLGIIENGNAYAGDAVAMQAQLDAASAYTAAANATGAISLTGKNLGGLNLTQGVYVFSSSAQLTGTLTLNAQGLQNAVFIFQIGSTLTTAANAVVDLINATAGDSVIWQVGSSATLGTDTEFAGDILALTSITLDTNASIACGAALALNGAVTLDNNTVSTGGAACSAVQAVPEPASAPIALAWLIALATVGFSRRARLGAQVQIG